MLLAYILKKTRKNFIIKCENGDKYKIKIENNLLSESLDEFYQTGSLFYFDPLKKGVVFPNEAIVAEEDYSIPKERTDLIE